MPRVLRSTPTRGTSLAVGARWALVVLIALVASCSTDEQPIESQGPGRTPAGPGAGDSWGPLAVVAGQGSGGEALIVGDIVIGDNCVLLDERGDGVLLVWPEGRTAWDQETATVRYARRDGAVATIRNGDPVAFGGGGSSQLEGGQSAEDFLTSVEWVAPPQRECVADTRWFVGDLVDTSARADDDSAASGSGQDCPATTALSERRCRTGRQ